MNKVKTLPEFLKLEVGMIVEKRWDGPARFDITEVKIRQTGWRGEEWRGEAEMIDMEWGFLQDVNKPEKQPFWCPANEMSLPVYAEQPVNESST